jgi:hypothetical protein
MSDFILNKCIFHKLEPKFVFNKKNKYINYVVVIYNVVLLSCYHS